MYVEVGGGGERLQNTLNKSVHVCMLGLEGGERRVGLGVWFPGYLQLYQMSF